MTLSIVIVTYNSEACIKACLDALGSQRPQGVEVIVVDNASVDGTRELIGRHGFDIVLVKNSCNRGASAARNQGIAISRGEWILTLDSDVVLRKDFVSGFLAVQKELPGSIGMIQPNILDSRGDRVYSQGIFLSSLRRFFDVNQGVRVGLERSGQRRILGPCSASAFYRRSMLEQLKEATGYFDERFFFLVEDVDLAWRARHRGWDVRFCPELVCYHSGNGSRTDRALRQYLCCRNRHLMIAKNESFAGKVRVYGLSWPYDLARMLYAAVFNKYMRDKWGIIPV